VGHGAVRLEKENPNGPAVSASVVVPGGSNRQIIDAVAIEIADIGNGGTESVVVVEGAPETSREGADFLLGFDRTGVREQEDTKCAAIGSTVVIAGGADGHVGYTVVVQIAERGDGAAEPVFVIEPGDGSGRRAEFVVILKSVAKGYDGQRNQE